MSETPGVRAAPLAIEVTPLDVVVRSNGSSRPTTLFLRTASERHLGAETLAERLADPHTTFLPAESDGEVELVNLDRIEWIEARTAELEEVGTLLDEGAHRQPVRCELAGGETVVGELLYHAPSGAARISDVVNDPNRRFLLVLTGDEARYVVRTRIHRIRFGVDLCP